MKTERMVLLVTPEEKALINSRAAAMGVSASEFVRRAVELFDPDDIAAIAELETLLPELEAMANRLERDKADWPRQDAEREAARAYYASDAYREEVRQQVLADPNIDWERARKFFSGGPAGCGMTVLADTVTGVRRILRLDEDVQELKRRADDAEDRLIDLDRRMVRLESVFQFASGVTLPPLTPRLPR